MTTAEPAVLAPPRVLLVMPEQWPRALLRAALREVGYDALGAPGLPGALRYRAQAERRGAVRLVLVDQAALGEDSAARLAALLRRFESPAMLLLARAMPAKGVSDAASAAQWARVIRRPVSIEGIVTAVQEILPLPPASIRPLD
jgi:CheY-like chemotaxis protein